MTLGAILAKRLQDDALKFGVNCTIEFAQSFRITAQNRRQEIAGCRFSKRMASGKHFVQNNSETPHIRARVNW